MRHDIILFTMFWSCEEVVRLLCCLARCFLSLLTTVPSVRKDSAQEASTNSGPRTTQQLITLRKRASRNQGFHSV